MSRLRFSAFWLAAILGLSQLVACGGGGASSSSVAPAPPSPVCNVTPIPSSAGLASNVTHLVVDSGPTCNEANRLYASVTVCQPGTANCQTIDHVLVDTGSTGLRVFASALAPSLALPRLTGTGGNPLFNCAQFVDNSYAFGPVATADIKLNGETALATPMQIIADPAYSALGGRCRPLGTALSSASVLGANGIIGMGFFKDDCGAGCISNPANGFYYTCTTGACTAITGNITPLVQQLANPVARFASHNNGIIITMPAVNLSGAPSAQGTLTFGIGTSSNNVPPAMSVLAPDAQGYVITTLPIPNLPTSFIDTGSNGLYFGTTTYPLCANGFYCPSARTALSASIIGFNAVTKAVSFFIDNALALFSTPGNAVLPTLSGPIGDNTTFDWGLPFFFGRTVYIVIENQASSLGTGPLITF
jgi:hypothetical protein